MLQTPIVLKFVCPSEPQCQWSAQLSDCLSLRSSDSESTKFPMKSPAEPQSEVKLSDSIY
eukprot:6482225-Amphidinium_carterae.1